MAEPIPDLTPAQIAAINAAFDTILQNAQAVKVVLLAAQRKTMLKQGQKSRSFVEGVLRTAKQYPDALPRSFSTEEFDKTTQLSGQLEPLAARALEVDALFSDSLMWFGGLAMKDALRGYKSFQDNEEDFPGLQQETRSLGERFDRKPDATPPQP